MIVAFGAFNVRAQDDEGAFKIDQNYEVSPDGTLELDTHDAHVEIVGSDRQDAHVYVFYHREVKGLKISEGGKFDMEVSARDGNLVLRQRNERNFSFIGLGKVIEKYSVRIEAPQGMSLNIRGDDDDYNITGMNGSIWLKADDGEAYLRDCDGDRFEITMEDGEFEMNRGRGSLRLQMDDGDARVMKGAFTDINAEAEDGDIEITSSLADDGSYYFRTDDGDVNLRVTGGGGSFIIHHDDGHISADMNFERLESGEHRTRYRLKGGSASVSFETNDGDVRLEKY